MAETPNEFQLKNPPTDGVTAVKFGPNSSQFLLSSSWDTSVRLYDVISNHLRMKYNHPAPVLDCCFHVSKSIKEPGLLEFIVLMCFQEEINLREFPRWEYTSGQGTF